MKKLDLRSGSQRHRHYTGFFNVPLLHRPSFLYGDSDTPSHLVAFYDTISPNIYIPYVVFLLYATKNGIVVIIL